MKYRKQKHLKDKMHLENLILIFGINSSGPLHNSVDKAARQLLREAKTSNYGVWISRHWGKGTGIPVLSAL